MSSNLVRCAAKQALVHDDASGPQIDLCVVLPLQYHLWCHVEWSALDGGQHEGVEAEVPGKPEVTELGPALGVQEDVLRLDVPVEDPVGVEVVEGGDQLTDPELPHHVV